MSLSPVQVEIFKAEIPLRKPFRIATMVTRDAELVFVRVIDASGLVGWGEAAPLRSINGETQSTCLAACEDLAQFLVGQTFDSNIEAASMMESALAGQATARSALDMALNDVEAQKAGKPLVELLQGKARRMPTDLTVPIVAPDEAAEQAVNFVAGGYGAVKIKLGDGPANDLARVNAVRDAIPAAVRVRVDANQAYDAETAKDLLDDLSAFDIEFCEQPVARYELKGLQWLHQTSPVPVMADESVFTDRDAWYLLKDKVCGLLNVKLSKCGSLHNGRNIGLVAAKFGAACMHGGMVESRLGATAASHLASSQEVFKWFDLDSFHSHSEDPILGGMVHVNGDAVLPDAVGLGATVDPVFLARCERRVVSA
ncbi:MAG: dipeptide epimerase [Armatimonadetes bacterium]|nr:dipeptide epimerase [Armatimonadota bacterium]